MTVEHINKNNFEEHVQKSEIPVVIDFWAEWCGPCKMMGPVFDELSKDYEGKVKFVKVNTEEEPELAGAFQVRGIPTLSIVKGNEELNRIVGFLPKESLKEALDKELAKIK